MRIRKVQLFGRPKKLAKLHLAPGNCNLLPKKATFGRRGGYFLSPGLGPPSGVHGGPTTKKGSKSKKFLHFRNQREKLTF